MFPAIFLGIVQGLTEFLPISSSGHLVLIQHIFGFRELDPAFNVFVQGGTVFSVLLYFRHRLPKLTRNYLKLILLATIPAAIAGLLLASYLDQLFSSLIGAALGFFLTTVVVLASRFITTTNQPLTPSRAIRVGLFQAAAILPGLSRSGTTITAGLWSGLSPVAVFEFSFLLSIPTIAGASLLSIPEIAWTPALTPAYLVGFMAAFVSGYFALELLAKLLQRGRFYLFAPYTAMLSILTLILAFN
jgi:undecaprenyl-diphosphatase